MPAIYKPITAKKSTKRYFCNWCAEWIEKGESYTHYFINEDHKSGMRLRFHPECYEARIASGRDEFYPGDQSRGCVCDPDFRCEHCEVKTQWMD